MARANLLLLKDLKEFLNEMPEVDFDVWDEYWPEWSNALESVIRNLETMIVNRRGDNASQGNQTRYRQTTEG